MCSRSVAANGPLWEGMDEGKAPEILLGLSGLEMYLLVTQYAGWSTKKYAAWLTEALERLLLPWPAADPGTGSPRLRPNEVEIPALAWYPIHMAGRMTPNLT